MSDRDAVSRLRGSHFSNKYSIFAVNLIFLAKILIIILVVFSVPLVGTYYIPYILLLKCTPGKYFLYVGTVHMYSGD